MLVQQSEKDLGKSMWLPKNNYFSLQELVILIWHTYC